MTIKKSLMAMLSFSLAIFFLSCNDSEVKKDEAKAEETVTPMDTSKAETPAPPAFTPFKAFVVQHKVAKFDKWKEGYMSHDSLRTAYGISRYRLGRGTEDTNMVIVIDKIADVQKAKDFAKSASLKDAMSKAGVVGKPDISYTDVIWMDPTRMSMTDRVRVTHKVKDFDAWKKVYDSEGTAKRAQNGLIDVAMSRDIDDPNIVTVVFAISDMAKAKARASSEELKKLMTEAGVIGAPKVFFYKLLE